MKKITFKKVLIDYGEGVTRPDNAPEFMDYRQTIMGLLKTPKDPTKGADFEETAEAMPIWLKLREHKEPAIGDSTILLEDAEHKFVMDCLKNAKYVARTYELYEMIQSVIDAPDHLVVEKEA